MRKLTILVGCPASGKSTYAEWIVKTCNRTFRISRDEIRFSQFADLLDKDGEYIITKVCNEQIKTLLSNGWDVVVDNCHTRKVYIDEYIREFSHLANIEFKVFELPLEELLVRDNNRARKVGKKVIEKMYTDLQELKNEFNFDTIYQVEREVKYVEQDKTLPKAIVCDLDGTLALLNGRDPYDASACENDILNEPVASLLRKYRALGYKVLLVSGREDVFREQTNNFLEKHDITYEQLIMRKKKDYRKDNIVKKQLYEENILNKYYVEFVLDDRDSVVEMWRNIGLPCFQVNYGNF